MKRNKNNAKASAKRRPHELYDAEAARRKMHARLDANIPQEMWFRIR